jgi:hypothetical protein
VSLSRALVNEEAKREMTTVVNTDSDHQDRLVADRGDQHDIGTALTRRPKPKPVLSFAELVTIVWLRAKPVANISPGTRSGQ